MRVSVVIPLYNKQAHIERALRSALDQEPAVHEVVVVDDGSTDDGAAVVERIAATDARVRLLRQENGGVSRARNAGIAASTGDLIAFLDADDEWTPAFMSILCETATAWPFPSALAYGVGFEIVDGPDRISRPRLRGLWSGRETILSDLTFFRCSVEGDMPLHMSAFAVWRETLRHIAGDPFPAGEPMGEDQDLYVRILQRGDIALSRRVGARYRRDAENRACARNVPAGELPFARRLQAAIDDGAVDAQAAPWARRYIARHLVHVAAENVRTKRWRQALGILLGDRRCWLKPLQAGVWTARATLAAVR